MSPSSESSVILTLTLTCLLLASVTCQSLRELGHIPAPHAAFASLVNMEDSKSVTARSTLVITGFNPIPLFHDTVYQVTEIGRHLDDLSNAPVTEVTRGVTWPNEARQVPDAVFGRTGLIAVAGGFLVPLKDHGSLTLFDLDLSPPAKHALTSSSGEDSKWFYHRVEWKDMNGDGLLDLLTCRARTHLLGSTEGQMVWFEHPQENALSHPWQSHVIADGPDVFFTVTSLPTSEGDKECIITAGFFSKSLNIYWTTSPQNRWDDVSMIQKRVIDNTIGDAFDVTVTDLNLDGTLDLMVTNNALTHASLFAYTVPADFRTGDFSRRVLSTGYTSRTSGTGHGAPGSALLVSPRTDVTAQKPYILVSGDDAGQAFLVQPSSNSTSDWSYQQSVFLDVGHGTVGGIAAGDVDGDGYNEVFVPAFNEGKVYVFTFKP
ncbi:uncharacterized protein LOC143301074 [Babylonia areolata]|uniref:uncharacterized protein LOC143301074 n=1 Tax=Babylonia areolata TaxID=304850 RepID=UPI003FD36C47